MLRWSRYLHKARITAFSPWRRRPDGLHRNSTPEMVHPGHFRHAHRRNNPDDPTRLIKPQHVLIKECSLCRRSQFIKIQEKDYFHTCCEGQPMRLTGTAKSMMDRAQKLTVMHRQWDVENEQPWCAPHKPRPKGRSKFKK